MTWRQKIFAAIFAAICIGLWAVSGRKNNDTCQLNPLPWNPSRALPQIPLSPQVVSSLRTMESIVSSDCLTLGNSGLYHWMLLYGRDSSVPNESNEVLSASSVLCGIAPHPVLNRPIPPFHRDAAGQVRTVFANNHVLGESHHDQIFAIFGELGFPTSTTVGLKHSGDTTELREGIEQLMQRFEPNLIEPEFAAVALSAYVLPNCSWENRNGDRMSLEVVLADLLSRTADAGTCAGTHRAQAIARLVMLDRETPYLSPSLRSKGAGRLQLLSARLEQNQLPNGGWGFGWFGEGGDQMDLLGMPESLAETLHVTAHHLEWICLCDSDLQPSKATVQQAMKRCSRVLELSFDEHSQSHVCPRVHAFRCLALAQAYELTSKYTQSRN